MVTGCRVSLCRRRAHDHHHRKWLHDMRFVWLERSAAGVADDELAWSAPSDSDKWWTSFKLAFALPWRRFPKDSVLAFKVRPRAPCPIPPRAMPGHTVGTAAWCMHGSIAPPHTHTHA